MAAQIKIAKFQLYPADEPTGYAVGFGVKVKGRDFYRDTIVPLDQCTDKTEDQILDLAYEQLRDGIESQVTAMEVKSDLIGKSYTPPEVVEP